MNVRNNW